MIYLQSLVDTLFDSKVMLTLLCCLLLYYIMRYMMYYAGTPPGPWGIPIFGYMYFLSKKPYIDFSNIAKKYGNVFSITIGTRHVIVLNDYEAIKEAFVNGGDVYAGKPRNGIEPAFGDYKSVFVTDGELWKEQKRFLLSSMRDFGFGKKEMEEFLQNEAEIAIEEMAKKKGLPYDVSEITHIMTSNSVASLLFGRRFNSAEDAPFIKALFALTSTSTEHSFVNIADALPFLEVLFFTIWRQTIKMLEKLKQDVYLYMDKLTEEHENTFDEIHIRDVTDSYLEKMHMTERNENKINKIYSKDYMRPNFMILFAAGTDTTSLTICWALKLLAEYPEYQKRVQKEIDDVIGRSRAPKMVDRINMPFTEAVILEVHRYISIAPLTFYHRIMDDTTLRNYKIPKDAYIIANLWNAHYDSSLWKNPDTFNPERFLDENGKISNLRERVIPFSIGTRRCLGEALAKMEIFIFLVSFLQKLTFKPPNGEKGNLDPELHIPVRRLLKYNICSLERD